MEVLSPYVDSSVRVQYSSDFVLRVIDSPNVSLIMSRIGRNRVPVLGVSCTTIISEFHQYL